MYVVPGFRRDMIGHCSRVAFGEKKVQWKLKLHKKNETRGFWCNTVVTSSSVLIDTEFFL